MSTENCLKQLTNPGKIESDILEFSGSNGHCSFLYQESTHAYECSLNSLVAFSITAFNSSSVLFLRLRGSAAFQI